MISQLTGSGWPDALPAMYVDTNWLPNMNGWYCSAASTIQKTPRISCRARCVAKGVGKLRPAAPPAAVSSVPSRSAMVCFLVFGSFCDLRYLVIWRYVATYVFRFLVVVVDDYVFAMLVMF